MFISELFPNDTLEENGHDSQDEAGRTACLNHFNSLPKEMQDLMRPRLSQDRGYWDSYFKARKQLSRSKQVNELTDGYPD